MCKMHENGQKYNIKLIIMKLNKKTRRHSFLLLSNDIDELIFATLKEALKSFTHWIGYIMLLHNNKCELLKLKHVKRENITLSPKLFILQILMQDIL